MEPTIIYNANVHATAFNEWSGSKRPIVRSETDSAADCIERYLDALLH